MQLQQVQVGSLMTIQIGYRQSPKLNHNPMDICAMLNPMDEASTTTGHHFESETETQQHFTNSPANRQPKHHLQLSPSISVGPVRGQFQPRPSYQARPINSEPLESIHYQSRQSDRLSSTSTSSSQALESSPDHEASSHAFYNSGHPTPPPSLASSPTHNILNHPQYLPQSFKSDPQQQNGHLPSSTSRASLSPQRRAQQEIRVRESRWSAQNPHVYHPYSPPHVYSGQRIVGSNSHHLALPPPNVQPTRPHPHPHSNKPYTKEQVHFIRYHREDCGGLSWPDVLKVFVRQFPEFQNADWPLTVPCLSSRYYRSNKVPMLDENGELVFDSNGKVIMIPCKVRGRNTDKGKYIPYLLVDMHPDFALVYDWVKPEDKQKAMRILQGLEEVDTTKLTAWQRHQQSLRKVDGKSQELALRMAQMELHVVS